MKAIFSTIILILLLMPSALAINNSVVDRAKESIEGVTNNELVQGASGFFEKILTFFIGEGATTKIWIAIIIVAAIEILNLLLPGVRRILYLGIIIYALTLIQ